MTFVQIIEFTTADIDSMRAASERWERATEGKRTARRRVIARDHNDPDRYFVLAFFDSYESAMVNSNLPETQAVAEESAKLAKSPPTFYDLDIIDDRA